MSSGIIYHWKNEKGQFKFYELPMSEYIDYETLKNKALGNDGFQPVAEGMEFPFTQVS